MCAARPFRTPPSSAQREVVDAFLAAAREGDFERLVSVLDPDVVLHADLGPSAPRDRYELHGVEAVAKPGAAPTRGLAS